MSQRVKIFIEKENFVTWLLSCFYGKKAVYQGKNALPGDFMTRIDQLEAHHKACLAINDIYSAYVSSDFIFIFNKVFNDDKAHYFAKKEILSELGNIYFSLELVQKYKKEFGHTGELAFFPSWINFSLWKITADYVHLESMNIYIPKIFLAFMCVREWIQGFIFKLAIRFYPWMIAWKMKGKKVSDIKKKYRYVVHAWNGWLSSYKGACRMEFLESSEAVTEKNTLYVVDHNLSDENKERLNTSDFDVCYFDDMIRAFNSKKYKNHIYPLVKLVSQKYLSIKNANGLMLRALIKAERIYIRWQIFMWQYTVENFIACQDPGHSLRTIIQKKSGAHTIFVFWSIAYEILAREDMNTQSRIYYSHLIYDYMVSDRMSIGYFQRNNNDIKKYIENGVLRASETYKVQKDENAKMQLRKYLNIPCGKKVITFFDNPIGRMGMMNFQEGEQFIRSIYQFVESDSKYFLVYKPRGQKRWREHERFEKVVQNLIDHPRVRFISEQEMKEDENLNPHELMGLGDLCISTFTSSVPFEAVSAGVRTICYVPSERFNRKEFEAVSFPNFCAFNTQDLIHLANYWLEDCSEEAFKSFQEEFIKPFIDSYLDGKSMERLQHFLSNVNSQKQKFVKEKVKI